VNLYGLSQVSVTERMNSRRNGWNSGSGLRFSSTRRQIKGSQFKVFEEAEGGRHFMFIENPEKFNRMITEY
jgi:hypothetical protein